MKVFHQVQNEILVELKQRRMGGVQTCALPICSQLGISGMASWSGMEVVLIWCSMLEMLVGETCKEERESWLIWTSL